MPINTEKPFNSDFNVKIIQAIEKSVKEEAGRIFEDAKQEAIKKFDRKKDEVLAGITLHIMKMMDIQYLGDRIIITLRSEQK